MKAGLRVSTVPPFDRMGEFVVRARDAGAASVWWPDHLMSFMSPQLWGPDEPHRTDVDLNTYGDPFVCMAAVAGKSGGMLLGTCVTDAIRRMPATLAQTAMTLDHLAPGRIVLGLGSGEAANYRPYGWDSVAPGARLREAAAEIRRLFDDPGPDDRGAVLGLRPAPGTRGPSLWLAAHGPRGLEATARHADGWLPMLLTPAEWAEGRRVIARIARQDGRDPSSIVMALSVEVILQDDHEEAHRLLRHPAVALQCLYLGRDRFAAHGAAHPLRGSAFESTIATLDGARLADAARRVPFELAHEAIPHGTPEEVAEAIRAYEGLEHVRFSDLSSLGGGRRGGLARILSLIRILSA